MTLVALQPATPNEAHTAAHYRKTVVNPITLDDYRAQIPVDQMGVLRGHYPTGTARLWGLSHGKHSTKFTRWQQLAPGTKVLFYTGGPDKAFTALATITYTVENENLGRALWSLDPEDDSPFKYLYFLDDVRAVDIPYTELVPFIRTRPDWKLDHQRSFGLLDQGQSAALLSYLGIVDEPSPAPDSAAYAATVQTGIETTDRAYTAIYRQEQRFLRSLLLQDNAARCDLCGREFDSRYLRAAHIKKRAACSEPERLDAPSIVMIACVFGCDGLYEAGHIGVNAHGHIVLSPTLRPDGPEHDYVRTMIKGRRCTKWVTAAASRRYFDWHFRTTYRGSLTVPGT